MSQILAKSKLLVTHFHQSDPAQSKLREFWQELNLPDHKLVQDVLIILLLVLGVCFLFLAELFVNFENVSIEEWAMIVLNY